MRISSDRRIYFMSPENEPAAYADCGQTITVDTMDCYDGMVTYENSRGSDIDRRRINPATGPIYVNGAEKGDTLAIEILDIKVGDTGIMRISPAFGALKEMVKESMFRVMRIGDGTIHFSESLILPVKPMVGVIGTSPETGRIGNETPGDHGGNMDTRDITTGTRVYLPVNVQGGLLALGDIHASMGDGESAGTGVEVCGEVTLRTDLIKNTNQKRPYIETKSAFYTVCSAHTLEEASRLAVKDGVKMIMKWLRIPFEDAYMLTSAACNLIISQIVDPLMTVRLEIPKELLKL